MRKNITLFFLTTVFLSACNNNKTPAGILDKPHMISLMTDINIVDGSLYNYGATPDSVYKYGTGKYLAVFKNHHTDSIHFAKSLKYYSTNTTELGFIFDEVTKILKKKSDSLNELNKKQQIQTQPIQTKPTQQQINYYKQQQIKQQHGLPIK